MTHITAQHRGAMLAAVAHLANAEWAALKVDLDALDVLKPTSYMGEVAGALAEAFCGGPEPLITGARVPRVMFGQVRRHFLMTDEFLGRAFHLLVAVPFVRAALFTGGILYSGLCNS
jgi:hypothetical protein